MSELLSNYKEILSERLKSIIPKLLLGSLLLHLFANVWINSIGIRQLFTIGILGVCFLLQYFAIIKMPQWLSSILSMLVGLLGGYVFRIDLLYAHTISVVLITIALVNGDTTRGSQTLPLRFWVFPILVALIVIILRLFTLENYPPLDSYDEPWLLSFAINYYRDGQMTAAILPLTVGSLSKGFYYILAVWFALFDVSLYNARLLVYVFTFINATIISIATYYLYGKTPSIWVFWLSIGLATTVYATRLRHDMAFSVTLSITLALYGYGIKRQLVWIHLLAGLVMGFGALFHPNAVFYGPVIAIGLYIPLWFLKNKNNIYLLGTFVLFCIGGAISALLILFFHIIPQSEFFLSIRTDSFGYLGGRSISQYYNLMQMQLVSIKVISGLDTILIMLALLVPLFTRNHFDIAFLSTMILWQLALIVGGQGSFPYLNVHRLPIMAILIARMFSVLISYWKKNCELNLAQFLALVGIFSFLSGVTIRETLPLLGAKTAMQSERESVSEWMFANVPITSVIVSQNDMYPYLWHYDFISIYTRNLMPSTLNATYPSDQDVWEEFDVQYFVIDYSVSSSERYALPEYDAYFQKYQFYPIYYTQNITVLKRGSS